MYLRKCGGRWRDSAAARALYAIKGDVVLIFLMPVWSEGGGGGYSGGGRGGREKRSYRK